MKHQIANDFKQSFEVSGYAQEILKLKEDNLLKDQLYQQKLNVSKTLFKKS